MIGVRNGNKGNDGHAILEGGTIRPIGTALGDSAVGEKEAAGRLGQFRTGKDTHKDIFLHP